MNTFEILMSQMEQMVIYVILGVLLVRTKVWNHDKLGVLGCFCDDPVFAGDAPGSLLAFTEYTEIKEKNSWTSA